MNSYIGGEKVPDGNGGSTGTIKRCMPVFDAIDSGYIIYSPADVFVTQRDGQPFFEWANFGLINFHPEVQAPTYPNRNGLEMFPKWTNPWSVKTHKGYSSLFIQPMHRESVFTILPGVVDTDTYTVPVNFPFTLNNTEFEGLIPAGTPIAQVIPIKRDEWKMNIGGQAEFVEQQEVANRLLSKFFDRYKSMFRQPKEYK
jgi:hypothetical protein